MVRSKPGKWYKWSRPFQGWCKLNVDGSAKDGLISGGGIIRDEHGNLLAAFLTFYGEGTNNYVEFLALLEGLELCREMGLINLMIECDSQIVVGGVRKGEIAHWRLEFFLRNCLKALLDTYTIQRSVRQNNCVADRLSARAQVHKHCIECIIYTQRCARH